MIDTLVSFRPRWSCEGLVRPTMTNSSNVGALLVIKLWRPSCFALPAGPHPLDCKHPLPTTEWTRCVCRNAALMSLKFFPSQDTTPFLQPLENGSADASISNVRRDIKVALEASCWSPAFDFVVTLCCRWTASSRSWQTFDVHKKLRPIWRQSARKQRGRWRSIERERSRRLRPRMKSQARPCPKTNVSRQASFI